MESQTLIVETTSFEELRGGGGKLKKPNRRNTPNTPYARPHQFHTPRHRWFSKLLDPAYRLISGGANYIFPSFFSKSDAVFDQNEANYCDELENENDNANNVVCRTSGEKLKGVVVDVENGNDVQKHDEKLKGVVVDVENGNDVQKHGEKFSGGGVDEIEKLIEEKDFSRDEINRLLEIIRSRAADDCNVGLEKKSSASGGRDVQCVVSVECGKTFEQNPEDSNRTIHGICKLQENKYSSPLLGNIGESAVLLETLRKPSEDELGCGRATWETSTPLFQSTLRNDVGASPIDIAKAYMENRMLELGGGSKSLISKDKEVLQLNDGFPSKPLIPLPSPKPSICWPGAMPQDQRIYKTPLSQRGRSGLHHFPRTPYSRSIGSKSRSKLQGDSDRHLSTIPPHHVQSLTSSYGQVGTRADALDSGRGSVGPIRRIERKVSETPRGFSYFHSPVNNHPQEENTSAFEKGKMSSSLRLWSVQNKAQTSDPSVPTVPSHSSEVARKILEHLERNPPTPKDKSAEIKLATSWRNPQSSYDSTSKTLGGLDSIRESEGAVQQKNLKDNGGYSIFKASQEDANKATASASDNSSTSGLKFGFSSYSHSNQTVPYLHSNKSKDSQQLSNTHQDVSNAVKDAASSELLGLRKKPPSSGTKQVLPAVSISKPGQRLALSMDNNSGFTFPISASSTVSSEPPTPSIMPSSTATAGDLQDGYSTPLYNFGSKRSTPAIVFSFPSTSNAPTSNDSSELKFNFGSDKSTRISFTSVGKDSICY